MTWLGRRGVGYDQVWYGAVRYDMVQYDMGGKEEGWSGMMASA